MADLGHRVRVAFAQDEASLGRARALNEQQYGRNTGQFAERDYSIWMRSCQRRHTPGDLAVDADRFATGFGMSGVGCMKHTGALDLAALGTAEVDGRWRVETETGVVVLMGVPAEEALAQGAAILDAADPSRNSSRYLRVLNCASRLAPVSTVPRAWASSGATSEATFTSPSETKKTPSGKAS